MLWRSGPTTVGIVRNFHLDLETNLGANTSLLLPQYLLQAHSTVENTSEGDLLLDWFQFLCRAG